MLKTNGFLVLHHLRQAQCKKLLEMGYYGWVAAHKSMITMSNGKQWAVDEVV